MKHAVIVAHPNAESLTCSVGKTYADAVRALGQEVVVRDLYRIGFDPCLKAGEIPEPSGFQFGADVVAERKLLAQVDVFAFIYPFWFNAPPAILKGYVDRVFSMGFGYEPGLGGTEPLLDGKRLISFTSSGAPEQWVRDTGALQALMTLFDRHLGAVCGLQVIDHVHVGGIVPDITEEAFEEVLQGVRRAVQAHFGGLARPDLFSLRSAT
ncbi:MAG: NAD(P)H-dependent oxidoreductase [Phenylobacterium sp.]